FRIIFEYIESSSVPYPIQFEKFGIQSLIVVQNILTVLIKIAAVLSCFTAFYLKVKWKKYGLLMIAMLFLAAINAKETIYMLPIAVMFANEEKSFSLRWGAGGMLTIIYLVLFICLFNPYQFPPIHGYSPTWLFLRIASLGLFFMLFFESIKQTIMNRFYKITA
ncbi:MAG: hypothetical protein LBV66_01875, partial [Elusimicrobiota bacterium]|nr:hypothetical protein [Elusimicrobiota bacterium]